MTAAEVNSSLIAAGFPAGVVLDDNVYDAVSPAFVVKAWEAWVNTLPAELTQVVDVVGTLTLRCPKWLCEVFDCDNIAADFAVYMDRCMAVDAVIGKKSRGNIAAGRFNFLRNCDPAQAHCRNWFIDYDGHARVFDAGNCQLGGQTAAETATTFFCETI